MKRVRHIYITRWGDTSTRIDSDDPRLKPFRGSFGAAMLFANRVVSKECGRNAQVLDIQQGQLHRMRPGQRRHQPHRPAARLDISGWVDWQILIGIPLGCGIIEVQEIVIQVRISRGRGEREYYEETAYQPEPKPDALFRKR